MQNTVLCKHHMFGSGVSVVFFSAKTIYERLFVRLYQAWQGFKIVFLIVGMRVVGDLENPSLKFEGLRCYRNPEAVNRSKK